MNDIIIFVVLYRVVVSLYTAEASCKMFILSDLYC